MILDRCFIELNYAKSGHSQLLPCVIVFKARADLRPLWSWARRGRDTISSDRLPTQVTPIAEDKVLKSRRCDVQEAGQRCWNSSTLRVRHEGLCCVARLGRGAGRTRRRGNEGIDHYRQDAKDKRGYAGRNRGPSWLKAGEKVFQSITSRVSSRMLTDYEENSTASMYYTWHVWGIIITFSPITGVFSCAAGKGIQLTTGAVRCEGKVIGSAYFLVH